MLSDAAERSADRQTDCRSHKDPVQADNLNGICLFGKMTYNLLQWNIVSFCRGSRIFIFRLGFPDAVSFGMFDPDFSVRCLHSLCASGKRGSAAAVLSDSQSRGVPQDQLCHGLHIGCFADAG